MAEEPASGHAADRAPPRAGSAFVDQAIWRQFREADAVDVFVSAWLALQCRQMAGATAAVVLLGDPDSGPFRDVAHWPDPDAVTPAMSRGCERAIADRQTIVIGGDADEQAGSVLTVAQPLLVGSALFGAVTIALDGGHAPVRDVVRQIVWGAGWLELLLLRQQARVDHLVSERTSVAFDVMACVIEYPGFRAACDAVVTELATHLNAEPVGIGFRARSTTAVIALSHAAQFGREMNVVRDMAAAMDEAIDQRAIVLYPPGDAMDYRVTRAHEVLAVDHKLSALLTLPMQSGGRLVGALHLQRPAGAFTETEIEQLDGVAALLGPLLEEKRRNDRSILIKIGESISSQVQRLLGRGYPGRKLSAIAALLVVVALSTVSGEYRVTAPAVVEGRVQRTVAAPFDGYVASQFARAGETVRSGDLLAALDDQDLALERLRWRTRQLQGQAEYDEAVARGQRAEANIVRAQIDQAIAQVALIDEQLARTRLKAPFDGIVVEGDLSQSVGTAVQRGQPLFVIAPLGEHRVILEVDESDVADVHPGQLGSLRLAAFPDRTLPYRIDLVRPVAMQADGRNYFRVEATPLTPAGELRPGMEGVAKTGVDERLLAWIWTRKLGDWLRLAVWRWLP